MRVLLATDEVPQSIDAVQVLESLELTQSPIVLHTIEAPSDPGFVPEVLRAAHTIKVQALHQKGKRLTVRISTRLSSSLGAPIKRVEEGNLADAVIAVANEEQSDLIVLGARGLKPIEELMFGSVSRRVLSEAFCPPLVVKKPLRRITRVLLPLEEADDADAARAFLEKIHFRVGQRSLL